LSQNCGQQSIAIDNPSAFRAKEILGCNPLVDETDVSPKL
jgi:hypothetical protein